MIPWLDIWISIQRDCQYENLLKWRDYLKSKENRMDVIIDYMNWKGERKKRTIRPHSIFYGATEWHPKNQWLLRATDLEKQRLRVFAIKDIHSWEDA